MRVGIDLWIIPARAGFTRGRIRGYHPVKDHPRSRGVYGCVQETVAVRPGSSPLARGLHRGQRVSIMDARIIPARAGFTGGGIEGGVEPGDHPRSRGVYRPG